MTHRRKSMMDIRAMLVQMRQGASDREISRNLKVHRQTVKSYRQWAQAQGLLTGELPDAAELQQWIQETLSTPLPPQNVSTVEPYRVPLVHLCREWGVHLRARIDMGLARASGGWRTPRRAADACR